MTEEKEKFKLEDVPKEGRGAVELRAAQQGVDVDDVVRHGLSHDFVGAREEKTEKQEARDSRKDQLKELKAIAKALRGRP